MNPTKPNPRVTKKMKHQRSYWIVILTPLFDTHLDDSIDDIEVTIKHWCLWTTSPNLGLQSIVPTWKWYINLKDKTWSSFVGSSPISSIKLTAFYKTTIKQRPNLIWLDTWPIPESKPRSRGVRPSLSLWLDRFRHSWECKLSSQSSSPNPKVKVIKVPSPNKDVKGKRIGLGLIMILWSWGPHTTHGLPSSMTFYLVQHFFRTLDTFMMKLISSLSPLTAASCKMFHPQSSTFFQSALNFFTSSLTMSR